MVRFIEWSNELSVGIEEIDNQHKVLIDLLNQIHEAIQQRNASEIIGDVLQKLGKYTHLHFAVEESLMRILHYPEYERHKEEHDRLAEQLEGFHAKLKSGKSSISFELAHFLKVWLTKHIMDTDLR